MTTAQGFGAAPFKGILPRLSDVQVCSRGCVSCRSCQHDPVRERGPQNAVHRLSQISLLRPRKIQIFMNSQRKNSPNLSFGENGQWSTYDGSREALSNEYLVVEVGFDTTSKRS